MRSQRLESGFKIRVTAAMLVMLLVLSLGLTGCGKKKKPPKDSSEEVSSGSSTSAEGAEGVNQPGEGDNAANEGSSESKQQELALTGTRLSWFVDADYKTAEVTDGWTANNLRKEVAVLCKRANLVSNNTKFDATNRIKDEMLQSRMLDIVEASEYTLTNATTDKVTIAEQQGYLTKANYQIEVSGTMQDYTLVIFATQFDSDIVLLTATERGLEGNQALAILNTITAARNVHTTWKE